MGGKMDDILSILATGLAGGLAKWTCIFEKVDLQNKGLRHTRA